MRTRKVQISLHGSPMNDVWECNIQITAINTNKENIFFNAKIFATNRKLSQKHVEWESLHLWYCWNLQQQSGTTNAQHWNVDHKSRLQLISSYWEWTVRMQWVVGRTSHLISSVRHGPRRKRNKLGLYTDTQAAICLAMTRKGHTDSKLSQ